MEEENNVASTSRNTLSRLYKEIDWQPGTRNLDLGAGRYQKAAVHLALRRVVNLPLDPFNRTFEENRATLFSVRSLPVDTVTLANVLHVIEDRRRRLRLLHRAWRYLKVGGRLYVSVLYTGIRRNRGRKASTASWIAERRLLDFLPEVRAFFPNAHLTPTFITATKEAADALDFPGS